MPISEGEALARLDAAPALSYDDLDEIFLAFGFSSDFEVPDVTWYTHPRYPFCGDFRAQERSQWATVSDSGRSIVKRMVACVRSRRLLEGN